MLSQQILKAQYKEAIKEDIELTYKIAITSKGHKGKPVSYRTIERWLNTDSDKLTTATTLQVIRDHLGLSKEEVLTETKEEVAADAQT